MSLQLIQIQKTQRGFIEAGVREYEKRLQRFVNMETITISLPKKYNQLPNEQLIEREGEKILDHVQSNDYLILLDPRGKEYTSEQFAKYIEKKLNFGGGNIIFSIGGAYGFSDQVYARANQKLSMSKMTTSHQLIRIIFLEQLYRAFSILHNHPYHNG